MAKQANKPAKTFSVTFTFDADNLQLGESYLKEGNNKGLSYATGLKLLDVTSENMPETITVSHSFRQDKYASFYMHERKQEEQPSDPFMANIASAFAALSKPNRKSTAGKLAEEYKALLASWGVDKLDETQVQAIETAIRATCGLGEKQGRTKLNDMLKQTGKQCSAAQYKTILQYHAD